MKVEKYLKTYRELIFKRNDEYIPLKKSDFTLFFETGDRLTYEKTYFAGRKALTVRALQMLLSKENDRAVTEKLIGIINCILSEPVWALPAHCGKDAWDTGKYGIDLFAAETAGSLAQILYLITGKIPEPEHKALVEAFERRFETEIRSKWEKEKPWWEEGNTNWTAVCAGNIGIAFVFLWKMGMISDELLAMQNDRIQRSLYTYIGGFGTDGCCREGISYYNYGMGYLLGLLELWEGEGLCLEEVTKIKSEINKRHISEFLFSIYLGNKRFVSFSDTTGTEPLNLGIFAYLSYMNGGLILPKEYEEGDIDGFELFGGEECGRFAPALREYLWVEKYKESLKTGALPSESLLRDAEWYVARFENGLSFAIKGGNNKEPHNHNDVGSFMLTYRGIPVVAELGSGEYTADYFGEKRYEYLCTGSKGHNVPVCKGLYQKTDTDGGAFEFREGVFTKDLSPSYGLEAGSLIRKAFSVRENETPCVRIEDRSNYDLTESVITFEHPKIEGENVFITVYPKECEGKTFVITFENAEKLHCEELNYKTHNGVSKTVFRVTGRKNKEAGYIALSITA